MQQLIKIMEDSQDFICSSKLSRAREGISSKFRDSLGMRYQKGSPALSLLV